MEQRTQEDIAEGGFTRFTICEPAFVGLETRKPDCHLWYDAGEDGTKTLVQRERRLAPHNHDASGYEAARFGLYENMGHIRHRALRTTHARARTPGARPDLESCMRTFIVSSGWQHNYNMVMIPK